MDSLANLEIFKSSFTIFIVSFIIILIIYFLLNQYNEHYKKTIGNIIQNNDFSETLIYIIDGKQYTHEIPPHIIPATQNAPEAKAFKYPAGANNVYYASIDNNIFNVGTNPITLTGLGMGIATLILIGSIIWFLFIRSNKNFASIFGDIGLSQNIIGTIRR
jgi:preprotein translocase subunit YajC